MTEVKKVSLVVIFGVLLSLVSPYIININQTKYLENENINKKEKTTSNSEVAIVTEEKKDESGTPVEIIEPALEQEPVQEPQTPAVEEPVVEPKAEPIVYDNLTQAELAAKLNRSLHSTLEGTGESFAKYAIEMGIDPYLAVAIVLHETGCNGTCSKQVRECYNVGGMKGGPSCNGTSYKRFNSLDEGIYAFMNNLKKNYYDKGLTTPEAMNKKYAASQTWAQKVHHYINKIKAA